MKQEMRTQTMHLSCSNYLKTVKHNVTVHFCAAASCCYSVDMLLGGAIPQARFGPLKCYYCGLGPLIVVHWRDRSGQSHPMKVRICVCGSASFQMPACRKTSSNKYSCSVLCGNRGRNVYGAVMVRPGVRAPCCTQSLMNSLLPIRTTWGCGSLELMQGWSWMQQVARKRP